MKPKCPNCGGIEFTDEYVEMTGDNCWHPVFCKNCGTIVGQLPNPDENEAMERLAKMSTLEELLGDIKSCLQAFEKILCKKS